MRYKIIVDYSKPTEGYIHKIILYIDADNVDEAIEKTELPEEDKKLIISVESVE